MINVSSWSIKNPIPAVMLFVMLCFAGMVSFGSMKVQNFPDIDLPTITVTASLPGTAPAQMETEVARKIENAIASLQGLKHITTKVQDGSTTISAEFRLEKPIQEALDDVRSAVNRIRSELPGDLKDPVISKLDLAGQPGEFQMGMGVDEPRHQRGAGKRLGDHPRRLGHPTRGPDRFDPAVRANQHGPLLDRGRRDRDHPVGR